MRVYFLATDLYHHMDTITHNSDELQLIKDYSLVHDLAEVVTGDLASNVKELISQKDPAILKTIEAKVLADIHPEAAGLHRSITGSYPEAIVKLCDLIEAYQYLEEWGSNSDFTHQVLGSLRLRLCDYTVKFKGAFPARDWSKFVAWLNNIHRALGNSVGHVLVTSIRTYNPSVVEVARDSGMIRAGISSAYSVTGSEEEI